MSSRPYVFTIERAQANDQVGPSAREIGEQIRQSVLSAREGALQASQELRQERLNEATAQLRAAEAQMKKARTEDQIRAAERAVNAAVAELTAVSTFPVIAGTEVPPVSPADMIPPQAVEIATGFFVMCAVMVVGWPLARAFGRRVERTGTSPAPASALPEQLQRIEQAVEAMSIEVERISESQRFMAKLQNVPLGDRAALPPNERG